MIIIGCVTRLFRKFRRDTRGSATVEAVLWLPMFFFVLSLAVDASMLFYAHNQVMKIIQDVNRSVSVGRLPIGQAETAIESRLGQYPNAQATPGYDPLTGIINTTVTVPARDILILDFVPLLRNITISVRSQQYMEQ
ncbi:TadE family protein [Ostreiculturibacter nitratireducens]|uniref:TadE/TadG family type IV pilus assembly protein n=1 Tax=Ostreiculturibacter nitratireducens TaxID=3075226 RepID=UPI0031B587E8